MIRTVALLALAAVAIVACGRPGPPRAPGPQEAITYPRPYPAIPGAPRGGAAAGAGLPSGPGGVAPIGGQNPSTLTR